MEGTLGSVEDEDGGQRESARERQSHSFHVCSFISFFPVFFTSFKN